MVAKQIKQFVTNLLKRGVSHSSDSKTRKRTQLVNIVCLFGMVSTFGVAILNLYQELYKSFIGVIFAFVLCTVIYLLNSNSNEKKQKAARLLLIASAFAFYFANANYLFTGKLSEYNYIFIVILTMVLLDSIVYQLVIFTICLLSFYLPNYFLHLYEGDVFGYTHNGLLFLLIFWLIRQLIDLNEKNEAKLLQDKLIILEQKQQIEELNELKSQFFIGLSHEIRTPLTLLQGYTESLMESKESISIEHKRKFQIIHEQGEQINDLISNILGLSKMDDKTFGLNTKLVTLSTFLDAIRSRFIFLFEKKNIAFELNQADEQIAIEIDTQLFEHALTNLLTNANKHTPINGEVRIETQIDTDHLYIKVVDNGKGIPKEHLSSIFERYFQVDESSISQGMGIGLSYTKRIVEAHGFEINVESQPNVRTCFSITIPIEKTKVEEPIDYFPESTLDVSTIIEANDKNRRILIAEDNSQMREFLASVLDGYHLTFAKNGKEGLAFLSRDVFDMLITDYSMPMMDGQELVQKVKSLNLLLPILVLTARVDAQAKRNMLRLGVDGYLTKPFVKEELLHNIEKSFALMSTIDKEKGELGTQDQKFINEHAAIFNQELNQFIDKHMRSNDFSVDTIASHFNISRSTLHRRVKSLLGQTTKQVIMEARLQKARELFLTMPHAKDKEIAEAVGIKNSTYLNDLMKKRFGDEF